MTAPKRRALDCVTAAVTKFREFMAAYPPSEARQGVDEEQSVSLISKDYDAAERAHGLKKWQHDAIRQIEAMLDDYTARTGEWPAPARAMLDALRSQVINNQGRAALLAHDVSKAPPPRRVSQEYDNWIKCNAVATFLVLHGIFGWSQKKCDAEITKVLKNHGYVPRTGGKGGGRDTVRGWYQEFHVNSALARDVEQAVVLLILPLESAGIMSVDEYRCLGHDQAIKTFDGLVVGLVPRIRTRI